MKITNKRNIPEYIASAVVAAHNSYQRGTTRFTATSLTKPPMMLHLEEKHDKELSQDVSEMVWASMGASMHSLMERGMTRLGDMREKRMYAQVGGISVSGQADLYQLIEQKIVDFKVTGCYAAQNPKKEWETQLQILAFLWRYNDFKVDKLENCMILRDWKSTERKRGYPRSPVVIKEWKVKDQAEIREMILGLITERNHDHPRECTEDEMWQRGDGQRIRCELFCQANKFCSSFKLYSELRSGKIVKMAEKNLKQPTKAVKNAEDQRDSAVCGTGTVDCGRVATGAQVEQNLEASGSVAGSPGCICGCSGEGETGDSCGQCGGAPKEG